MFFRCYSSLFFSAIAWLSPQKMPRFATKFLSPNRKLIIHPLLSNPIILNLRWNDILEMTIHLCLFTQAFHFSHDGYGSTWMETSWLGRAAGNRQEDSKQLAECVCGLAPCGVPSNVCDPQELFELAPRS